MCIRDSSMRASLDRLQKLRIGKAELVLRTGDRFFRKDIILGVNGTATVLMNPAGGTQPGTLAARKLDYAPILHLPAVISRQDGSARANKVNLLCVNKEFWNFAPATTVPPEIPPDGILLNNALARQLRAALGDELVVRAAKPFVFSPESPLAPEERTTVGKRVRVTGIVGDESFGRFALDSRRGEPLNAFVAMEAWRPVLGTGEIANTLLVRESKTELVSPVYLVTSTGMVRVTPPSVLEVARRALSWSWEDIGVRVRTQTSPPYVEFRSPRVFLEPGIARAIWDRIGRDGATGEAFAGVSQYRAVGLLTYFVNEIRHGERFTPYSMITAAGPPIVPHDLKDDEVLISDWLAEDLGAKVGDIITIRYYVIGRLRQLEEQSATFKVRAILPITNSVFEPHLMPDFPGMATADSCRDWDTGLPIQIDRIRPKDEQYWRNHRGTPKALITLAAGQKIWSNRIGD
ncbi:MAG: hypothetical protein N3G20_00335, partial [Verrucomicrobiae bacterium]|nr:hypothetical protein [Verrucomicrobiae bacterium]